MEKDKEIDDKFIELICELANLIFNQPKCPIFHYTSAAGLSGILKTKTLFFTRWDFLNDSSENLHIHEIIEECIATSPYDEEFRSIIQEANVQTKKQKLEKTADDNFLPSTLYIASFSSNSDALNMWTHYTKSGASDGYCIEFTPNSIFEDNTKGIIIREVVYKPEEKKKTINNLLIKAYDFYRAQKGDPEKEKTAEQYLQSYIKYTVNFIGCFFKHSAFETEKEIRAALFQSDIQPEYRFSRGLIIPYVAINFGQESVKSVRVSPTLPFREAHSGLMALQQILKYNFPVYQSKIPFRNI